MKGSRSFLVTLGVLATLILLGSSSGQAAVFTSGDIFAAVNLGRVQHYNAAGTLIETLNTTQGGFTTGMAFDSSGSLHVTNFSVNSISVFDNTGALQAGTCCAGSALPESITFNNAGNRIVTYVSGGVRVWDTAGVQVGATIQPGTRFDWGDLKADQATLLFTQEGGRVGTVDVSTGLLGPDFSAAVGNAFALRILSDGRVLVADNANVKLLDSLGALIGTYDVSGEDTWFSLNLNPDGTSFWSGNYGTGRLYEFSIGAGGTNLDTQTQTIDTGTGSGNLFGVAVSGEKTEGCATCGGGSTGVPEPATLILLGAGLLGLACRRHLRNL